MQALLVQRTPTVLQSSRRGLNRCRSTCGSAALPPCTVHFPHQLARSRNAVITAAAPAPPEDDWGSSSNRRDDHRSQADWGEVDEVRTLQEYVRTLPSSSSKSERNRSGTRSSSPPAGQPASHSQHDAPASAKPSSPRAATARRGTSPAVQSSGSMDPSARDGVFSPAYSPEPSPPPSQPVNLQRRAGSQREWYRHKLDAAQAQRISHALRLLYQPIKGISSSSSDSLDALRADSLTPSTSTSTTSTATATLTRSKTAPARISGSSSSSSPSPSGNSRMRSSKRSAAEARRSVGGTGVGGPSRPPSSGLDLDDVAAAAGMSGPMLLGPGTLGGQDDYSEVMGQLHAGELRGGRGSSMCMAEDCVDPATDTITSD